jgi:two-component system NtrC family sensor kinase
MPTTHSQQHDPWNMRPPPSDADAQEDTVADSERQQAGRLAMYEELTAALAHEINNPVYAARLALELLGQDLDSAGAESVYLAIATDGLRRVSAIIERLRLAIQNETLPAPDSSLDGLIAEAQRGHTLST